ncbi:glycosyltransferase family 2 protein [Aureispira anguillae]|uniref:Glycosyltransferase family 2 protein n=1 Tax=Aureispira anguillae TaxID=2864201 RepID=A0A915YLR7_9BACT|nr:glycosyltransferase family 2 protein [Aureispira anguillae]BDS15247.1 glycosyltransferase family 2 protein [Aureispira anguillae]
MLIDILIPTYNRGNDVLSNLKELQQEIATYNLWDQVQVIISDNCSPDNTAALIELFSKEKDERFILQYYRNDSNIGLEPNALAVLSKASSPFVLFLGDDDFLAKGYLQYCYESIQKHANLGCIIPGIVSIFKDNSTKDVRGNAPEKVFEAGFDAVLECSHWGHQMSGILCKRDGLVDSYLSQEEYRTPYLFLYFTAYSLSLHTGIYNPQYKTRVNNFNEKDWGYNEVGLLDEVYKCYYYFKNTFSEEQITSLLIRFTRLHSYRLAFSSKNLSNIYTQYKFLQKITPKLKSFKRELRKLFIKDTIRAFIGKKGA